MGIKNEQNSPALMELTFQRKEPESQQINDLLVKKSAAFKCYEEETWGSGITMDEVACRAGYYFIQVRKEDLSE